MSTRSEVGTAAPAAAALADLFAYPMMSALIERRTRRVARGVSLEAGELSHHSTNEPAPLSKLEEAILVVAASGAVGVTTHDGPLTKKNGAPELGTPFLNIMARTASSADNCQPTVFFMINDEGIWLVRPPTGRAALDTLRDLPPQWSDWSEDDWRQAAAAMLVKVKDRRLDFPREWPYYLGWNAQHSNVPGTTVFLPLVDCTWQYINAILIVAAEPDGRKPVWLDDWQPFRPRTLVEWLAKIAGAVGLAERIPYQPIGGLKWIREGYVAKDSAAPLGFGHALRTDYGTFFELQNLMLVGQAMGLGGWVHGSVFPPYIYHDDPARGWHGLGFRMVEPRKLSRTPPVPASQPNPVGIDGILEGLCPPYVGSMDEAVDRVIERKYGEAGGSYGDRAVFGRPYRAAAQGDAYLRQATRFSPKTVQYAKDICNYIYDTYGRFPAHVDAFYLPGIWLQFAHLELEYYERFFDPAQYRRQAEHDRIWHGADTGP